MCENNNEENKSYKERCVGLTIQEIKEMFKDDFNEETHELKRHGLYYKIAIDDDVCTDVWIMLDKKDLAPEEIIRRRATTFAGKVLTHDEEMILTSIIIDLALDENRKDSLTDNDVMSELIKRAEYYNKAQVARREIRKGNFDELYKILE